MDIKNSADFIERKLWIVTKMGFIYIIGFIFGMEQYTTDNKEFDELGGLIAVIFFFVGAAWMMIYVPLLIRRIYLYIKTRGVNLLDAPNR